MRMCLWALSEMSPVLEDLRIPPFFQLGLPLRLLCRLPDLQLYSFPRPQNFALEVETSAFLRVVLVK